MLELQGEISSFTGLDGQFLGVLKEVNGQWALTIGNHVLQGRTESLTRSLAYAKKTAEGVNILGHISSKLVFSSRPATVPDSSRPRPKLKFGTS